MMALPHSVDGIIKLHDGVATGKQHKPNVLSQSHSTIMNLNDGVATFTLVSH